MKRFGKLISALSVAALIGTATTPAMAQHWRGGGGWHGGGYHGGGWGGGYRGGYRGGWGGGYRGGYRGGRTGVAIGAGLLGLGIGAAIASSNRGGYYEGGPGYYGRPYRGYGYYGRCVTRYQWDPYADAYVPMEDCY